MLPNIAITNQVDSFIWHLRVDFLFFWIKTRGVVSKKLVYPTSLVPMSIFLVNVVNAWSFVCLDVGRLVVCPSRSVPFWVRFAFSKFVDSNLSFSFAISCAREKGTPPRQRQYSI